MIALRELDPALLVTLLATLHCLALITWVATRLRFVLTLPRRRAVSLDVQPAVAPVADAAASEIGGDEQEPTEEAQLAQAQLAEAQLLDDLERWRRSIRHDAA